jgi:uncharacterized membrane protein YcaP (DUF421 family)
MEVHSHDAGRDFLSRLGATRPHGSWNVGDLPGARCFATICRQRTLAKWYAFDLIVTVALGSTFANGILAKDVSIAQSIVAFLMLVGLQFAIAWTVVHWSPMRLVVNPAPTLLLDRGQFVHDAMRRQRVAEADVRAAVRRQGIADLASVGEVVLEADGTFSVIKDLASRASALADVPELGGSNSENEEP